MTAYYNEIDPHAAAWLRELIKAGHIAPGDVDERSIEDVVPSDLMGYTQCHFFAGIGVWSYALRCAGWPDNSQIWTGSCPCQPFSAAGRRKGLADDRNIFPAFFWLIKQCRPVCVIGEQVEEAIKHDWLDVVGTSLESIGYSLGSVSFPASSVGANHIRQRLYWVANANSCRNRLETHSYDQKIREQRNSESCNLVCKAEWSKPRPPGAVPMEVGNGTPDAVGRLRGYGNAIVAPAAEAFIRAVMGCIGGPQKVLTGRRIGDRL